MSYVTLHLGDCLEYMRTLESRSVDCVITDPPYGINIIRGGGRGMDGWRDYGPGGWDKQKPRPEVFAEMQRVGRSLIVWGGNYFTDCLPPTSQWLIWDKAQRDFSLADCELAWSSQPKAARVFTFPRAAMLQENGLHPTQKPLALMRWCIELASQPGDTIFDPYMGSGTTGVACIQTGRRFIGCEIDPGYFAIAQARIVAAQMQPHLIPPADVPPPAQAALLETA